MKISNSDWQKIGLFIVFLTIAGLGFFYRVDIKQIGAEKARRFSLPPAQTRTNLNRAAKQAPAKVNQPALNKEVTQLPAEINLAVPFVSQAPYQVWDAVHEETCEEASILMVDAFYRGIKKITPEEAEKNLLKLVDYQNKTLGYFEDTDAAQTAELLRYYFGFYGVKVSYNVTIERIKTELAAGRPVIVPAAGKLLGNPYFRGGGPDYHMLVIKGYTRDGRFITNDPGTRRGADYLYKINVLYNAINDWDVERQTLSGHKAMIVVQ